MKTVHRVFVVVCDSLGIGQAPDAADYGTAGAATFQHILERVPSMSHPTLGALGLDEIAYPERMPAIETLLPHIACQLREASVGKDTITGHWEMMGVETEHPFVTFTDTGFPDELIEELETRTGRRVIGNKAASGTEILDELAEKELEDPSKMIVYTSEDSVLQICGSEEVPGGLDELYRCCEIARSLTLERPEWKVGRVIARPYTGKTKGSFLRTSNRKDYTVAPPCDTVLDQMEDAGLDVMGIGKISDIFSGRGITSSLHSESSEHGMRQTIEAALNRKWTGLCFVNLADFDVKYGHRRDPEGYARAIESFDVQLSQLIEILDEGDLLVVTADHGNDPTFPGSDHTRENVPCLAYSPAMEGSLTLGVQPTFAVVGATVADIFELENKTGARSICEQMFA